MSQGVWATTTAGNPDFIDNCGDALKDYLDSSAPGNISTFLTNQGLTITKTPFPYPKPATSNSSFPMCYVWITSFQSLYTTAGEIGCQCNARLLVWHQHATLDDSSKTNVSVIVKNLVGAIASAIQQTRETSGSDWADFFCNHDQPEVSTSITYVEEGETAGLVQGQVDVRFSHKE